MTMFPQQQDMQKPGATLQPAHDYGLTMSSLVDGGSLLVAASFQQAKNSPQQQDSENCHRIQLPSKHPDAQLSKIQEYRINIKLSTLEISNFVWCQVQDQPPKTALGIRSDYWDLSLTKVSSIFSKSSSLHFKIHGRSFSSVMHLNLSYAFQSSSSSFQHWADRAWWVEGCDNNYFALL